MDEWIGGAMETGVDGLVKTRINMNMRLIVVIMDG